VDGKIYRESLETIADKNIEEAANAFHTGPTLPNGETLSHAKTGRRWLTCRAMAHSQRHI